MSALTSRIHLRNTAVFISENPIEISLTRPVRISTGTGGYRIEPGEAPFDPFVGRRVGRGGLRGADFAERVSENGHTVVPSWILIAMPEIDIHIGDHFISDDGKDCEILFIDRQPPWRVKAEVYEH